MFNKLKDVLIDTGSAIVCTLTGYGAGEVLRRNLSHLVETGRAQNLLDSTPYVGAIAGASIVPALSHKIKEKFGSNPIVTLVKKDGERVYVIKNMKLPEGFLALDAEGNQIKNTIEIQQIEYLLHNLAQEKPKEKTKQEN